MIGVSSRSQGNTARLFALSNKTGNTIQLELDSYLLSSFCLGRNEKQITYDYMYNINFLMVRYFGITDRSRK